MESSHALWQIMEDSADNNSDEGTSDEEPRTEFSYLWFFLCDFVWYFGVVRWLES